MIDRSATGARHMLGSALTALPPLWRLFVKLYNLRRKYRAIAGQHPIDRLYGIDTGGAIPGWLLGNRTSSDKFNTAYAGCQPSCLRAALATIDIENLQPTFIDLGCGKGRALFVASEYPFKRIIGVELARELCRIAEDNIKQLRNRYPDRVQPSIVHADATQIDFPPGNLVFFLCHSFGEPILEAVLDRIETLLGSGREIYFIYENPVYGAIVSSRPWFHQWFGQTVPADQDELPLHTGARGTGREGVLVWYSGSRSADRRSNADVRIVIEEAGWRASVHSQAGTRPALESSSL